MVALLDFIKTRGVPSPAVRARIALDIVERESSDRASAARGARVTLAGVELDEHGRASVAPGASHGHLATLLWEIFAGRSAESDELPWSDPAEDLPPGVLDTFASLTLRPALDMAELCRRFAAGIRSHAASTDEVARAVAGPERITLRAPPVQIEALRSLSAADGPGPVEEGIITRVCPVVTLPVASPQAVASPVLREAPPAEEQPRTTLDPWNAPASEITETSAAVAVEPELPRRRKTWPIVAASLAAALVLIGLASRRHIAGTAGAARSPASPPASAEPISATTSTVEAEAVATSSASHTSITSASAAASAPIATAAKTPPRWAARVPGATAVRAVPPQAAEPTSQPVAVPTAEAVPTAAEAPPATSLPSEP